MRKIFTTSSVREFTYVPSLHFLALRLGLDFLVQFWDLSSGVDLGESLPFWWWRFSLPSSCHSGVFLAQLVLSQGLFLVTLQGNLFHFLFRRVSWSVFLQHSEFCLLGTHFWKTHDSLFPSWKGISLILHPCSVGPPHVFSPSYPSDRVLKHLFVLLPLARTYGNISLRSSDLLLFPRPSSYSEFSPIFHGM